MNTEFVPERCWTMNLICNVIKFNSNPVNIKFSWIRGYIFDRLILQAFKQLVHNNFQYSINADMPKFIYKAKPLPLTTVQMLMKASKLLNMNSKQCMRIAEKLYQKGFISYPRTDTNIFEDYEYVKAMIHLHINNDIWGSYAQSLLNCEITKSKGNLNDNAHPPIHPVKSLSRFEFTIKEEWLLYEFICRHFLACNSRNAKIEQIIVSIDIAEERFICIAQRVVEPNFLQVYFPYEKWEDKNIDLFGNFTVNSLNIIVQDKLTKSPPLLDECALINLMNQNKIGTDATIQEHIATILERSYANCQNGKFIPTNLGIALIVGMQSYAENWLDLSKPHLRSQMEKDISCIATQKTSKAILTSDYQMSVLNYYISKMENIFSIINSNSHYLDSSFKRFLSGN